MKRHYLVLQSAFVDSVHRIMNSLISDSVCTPTLENVRQAMAKTIAFDEWTDDPLVTKEPPQLHQELALSFILSTACTYIEAALRRHDDHVTAYAIILLLLFWRPGLEYRVKTERLEWLKEAALASKYDNCHDAMVAMLRIGAFAKVVWSRNANLDEVAVGALFDRRGGKRMPVNKSELKPALTGLHSHAISRCVSIEEQLPVLKGLLEDYDREKDIAIRQSAHVSKSRAWKSGLKLIRLNLPDNIQRLLDDVSGPMKHDDGPLVDQSNGKIAAPTPKRPKNGSSSSSSSLSSTPFQEAEDMPELA